ncbi:Na+/H+ antiporter subunit B [Halorhodospira halochloris]|uniref:Na+/H+ antiporter subunit B n=1 Tax=Halorhodospira halochloris TaxID=1052 RepID=UPI0015CFC8BC|nr:Na+/H+ antiporter subunit B [Halorhodospira halochloris]MCG5530562.1 Na+/H+ antiporter subunit B [Halorhodospira halochloris]MCG5547856.1 Na+/H+ antiporter subunit B [Halorhodospira halochloris]
MQAGSLILSTMARVLLPLQLIFSIFMLLRGHDLPGGGFIAGLIGSAAFILYLFAFGGAATQSLLRVDPRTIAGVGLVIGTLAAVPPIFIGEPFFTALWWYPYIPLIGEVSINTPLIFDIGVYLTVIGSVLTIVIFLAEAEEEE